MYRLVIKLSCCMNRAYKTNRSVGDKFYFVEVIKQHHCDLFITKLYRVQQFQ